jgi:hypothetical protein
MPQVQIQKIPPYIGRSLIYLVDTRPDICYAINALSQFMCEPTHLHIVTMKHILRYVSSGSVMLHVFTDSVWMGNTLNRKSTSEFCFSLGSEMIS